MLKKVVTYASAGLVSLGVLYFVANRPISEVFGFVRASASTTVKSLENEIPDVIHDEKAQAELTAARHQLVDRQVQLNLSQNQLKGLQNEIGALTESIGGRKQVLGSAYPVLQKALDGGQEQITFISTKFSLNDFQHEIDDLLAMQDRDENALRIKQQGYERLAGSVADGEAALTEMKNRLLEIEQEFAVLKTRRDQARMESETLDLVAGATAEGSSATANVGTSVKRLEGQVEQLEARNEARRDVAAVDQRASQGKLSQSFNRLEALKKYAAEAENVPAAKDQAEAGVETKVTAKEVVIRIQGEDAQPAAEKE
jgi:peptidoglycan hydrolase CwlO-like protein